MTDHQDKSRQSGNITEVSIYHQNVCGITSKRDELEVYLHSHKGVVQYVCITEHFLNKYSAPLFKLDNHYVATHNTRINMTRGGSLILAHNQKQCADLAICKKLYKNRCFEVCGVLDHDTGLNIICCYRNPDYDTYDDFLVCLEKLLEHFFDKKCIICGDFNIDTLCENNRRNEFLSQLKCYNFRVLIDVITFVRNDASSSLDNFLTNIPEEHLEGTSVDHNGLADGHAAIFCDLALPNLKLVNKEDPKLIIERRLFSENNNERFREEVIRENLNEKGINGFLASFNNIFQRCFSKRKKKISLRKSSKIKWITPGIKTSSKMKRFLVVSSNCDDSIRNYRNKYIKIYRRVLTVAKKIAVRTELDKAKYSSKALWKVVNGHRNKNPVSVTDKLI